MYKLIFLALVLMLGLNSLLFWRSAKSGAKEAGKTCAANLSKKTMPFSNTASLPVALFEI